MQAFTSKVDLAGLDQEAGLRRSASFLSIVLLLGVVHVAPTSAAVTAVPWKWRQSGLLGGGFQNVIATDPRTAGTFVVGGELSGYHRTANQGTNWYTSNLGLNDLRATHAAAIAFSPNHPGVVYAAGGPARGGGAFASSTDGGIHWTLQSTDSDTPRMSSLTPLCGGGEHPRATGNLIALDDAGPTRYIYVGSLRDGIKRSTDGGKTWRTIALNGAYIRTLIADPYDPTILYAGVCSANGFSRAYKITNARGVTPTVTQLTAAPSTVEEFTVVGKTIYAAANTSGIYKVTNGGATWTELGSTVFSSSSKWGSMTGYVDGSGRHVLYAGAASSPVSHGNGTYRSIAKSTDSGVTWTWVTVTKSNVHMEIPGTTQTWWLPKVAAVGGSSFSAAQMAINPRSPQTVMVAGRSGVWRSSDGGVHWYPVVNGLGVALTNAVAAKGASMYAGTGDWTGFASKDHGGTVKRIGAGMGGSYGYATTVASDGAAYLSTGHVSTNTSGKVLTGVDPYVSGLTDMNLPVSGKRVGGLVTGSDAAGVRVVLAAVHDGGMWRKVGSAGWAQVALPTQVPIGAPRASLTWPNPSAPYVYLSVAGTGLFRSADRGVTWTKIWSGPTFDVAGDPSLASGQRIYVYRETGVYRIWDARTGTVDGGALKPVKLPVPQMGPVAVDKAGRVYVAGTGSPAGLYSSGDFGLNWSNHADSWYPRAALFPMDLAVSGDGYVYVGLKRNGVIIGSP